MDELTTESAAGMEVDNTSERRTTRVESVMRDDVVYGTPRSDRASSVLSPTGCRPGLTLSNRSINVLTVVEICGCGSLALVILRHLRIFSDQGVVEELVYVAHTSLRRCPKRISENLSILTQE